MRNPFTYLRELSDDLKRAQDRLVQEILRSDKAQKELAEAKAKIQSLHLDLHATKTYVEVLENSLVSNKDKDAKNQYDELDIPKK